MKIKSLKIYWVEHSIFYNKKISNIEEKILNKEDKSSNIEEKFSNIEKIQNKSQRRNKDCLQKQSEKNNKIPILFII